MKKLVSFIFIFSTIQIVLAQTFQGKINRVPENGLHQIVLSPEVISATKNDVNHIRIYDSKNKEVPYILFGGKSSDSKTENFPIISKKAVSNVATSVIISNENLVKLNELTLKIANTEVDKKYNISGSNDGNEWFGLVNNQTVTGLNEAGKTSVDRSFSFPLNNYKYLKFDFIDKNSLPINVLGASLEKSISISDVKIALENFEQKITTDKKNKQTRIEISFKQPQAINGIGFEITLPNFYLRNARILVSRTKTYKKNTENYEETFSSFELNSKLKNQFDVSDLFTKSFIIEIDNQDNPELEIKKINILQRPISILADLKSNENYTLKINPELAAPSYDLAQSGINFNQNFPSTTVSNLESIQKTEVQESKKEFWQTPLFMWICIIIAIVIIGYFSVGMIKDMNKDNS
jgi:hypothetical protein